MLTYKAIIFVMIVSSAGILMHSWLEAAPATSVFSAASATSTIVYTKQAAPVTATASEEKTTPSSSSVFTVPFYSQFRDITPVKWRKVGCGIASLAMIIDFYTSEPVSVDDLLHEGIAANAFLSDAGWTHSGLIGISREYGLTGETRSLAALSMKDAFSELEAELEDGPVMVSVHYTFDPKNPIPHLVVVNGVHDGMVYYNDPAEIQGGERISISTFQKAWKKRYIEFHPVS